MLDTLPMPLDALGAAPGGLDEFRVNAPGEIATLLRRLYDAGTELQLHAGDDVAVAATVWTTDAGRGSIGLAVDASDPALATLLESDEVVAVGYLDSVKVQFELSRLMLVRGARASVLSAGYPRELFRFQRRSSYRVRPLMRGQPIARVRHTDIAEMQLALRVLDVGIGGCALLLPDDVPPLQVGGMINQVEIELDADTRFHVDVRLQHVTSLQGDGNGVRLGCEFVRVDAAAQRALQRFIDLTQKRGKLLSLG
ncbi:MAG TPA: flagellar regulator YcgR PilZN domain-containing protein [Burkholderiaceae bacterium]